MIGEFVAEMLIDTAVAAVGAVVQGTASCIKDALSPTCQTNKHPKVPPKAVKAKPAKPKKKPYVSRDNRQKRNLKKKLDLQKRRAIVNSEGA